jgi:3-methyladenine DNA glycosylase AlkC
MPARKGALRPSEVPHEILEQLNRGTLETATLAEGLAIDFRVLLRSVAPDVDEQVLRHVDPGDGITRRMLTLGRLLFERYGAAGFERFAAHPSDTVRGWAAFLLASIPHMQLHDRLAQVRPLANDPHFAVREWAWLALRPHIATQLPETIRILTPWAEDAAANIRRFAIESTRPRGVWCAHIPALKQHPELALPLLEPVKADPSRYVQDSAANWLNDAAKSQPQWVRSLCERWRAESSAPATIRICTRALRSLKHA